MVMHTSKGVKTEKLPFVLELKDFRLNRYPGSNSSLSYESTLLVYVDNDIREVSVFMNNVWISKDIVSFRLHMIKMN